MSGDDVNVIDDGVKVVRVALHLSLMCLLVNDLMLWLLKRPVPFGLRWLILLKVDRCVRLVGIPLNC